VLQEERQGGDEHQQRELLRVMLDQDFIDDPFSHHRKSGDHDRAEDGAGEGARSHPWITLQISKNAPDCVHGVDADSTTIDCGLLFEFVSKLGFGISNPGGASGSRFDLGIEIWFGNWEFRA
jgi:hypothetical protein